MCRLHASPSEPRWRSSPLCLAWTTRNAKKLKKEKGHHHLAWTTRNIYKSHGKKKKKQQSWWKNKSFSKILAFAECWMLQHWLCSIPEKKILKKGKSSWKEFTVVVCRNIEEVSQRKQEFCRFSGEANKTMRRLNNRIMIIIIRTKTKNGSSNFFIWISLGI